MELSTIFVQNDIKLIEELFLSLKKDIKLLNNEVNVLEKDIANKIKNVTSSHSKPIKNSQVLSKKMDFSKEMCIFLNCLPAEKHTRTNVIRIIMNYINVNNLSDGKNIIPDEKIKRILELNEKDKLTFFNIHRYIHTSQHDE